MAPFPLEQLKTYKNTFSCKSTSFLSSLQIIPLVSIIFTETFASFTHVSHTISKTTVHINSSHWCQKKTPYGTFRTRKSFHTEIHIIINFIFTSYKASAQYQSLYGTLSSLSVINPTRSLSGVFYSTYYLKYWSLISSYQNIPRNNSFVHVLFSVSGFKSLAFVRNILSSAIC